MKTHKLVCPNQHMRKETLCMIQIHFKNDSPQTAASLSDFEQVDGEGKIDCYPLFDGIFMMILRFELRSFTERRTQCDAFELNFCANGRFETDFSAREHVILGPGDMAVSRFDGMHGAQSESRFPLGYYEGVCLEVKPEPARRWLLQHAPCFDVDFDLLQRNLLSRRWYAHGPAGPRCEHVFRELFENASYCDLAYLQLKAIELLMLLCQIPRIEAENAYCSPRQLELIRHLRDHLLTDEGHVSSLAQLAAEHGISVSYLQKLFKQAYGVPVYRYVKEYRLEQAAVELTRTQKRVTDIALDAGYDSASKFAECFKKRYGMTPSLYRTTQVSKRSE